MALGASLRGASCSSPNWCDVAVIKVTNFDAVVEEHPVALPVEAIREQDVTLCSIGHHSDRWAIDFTRCADAVPKLQIDLIGMWLR